MSNHESVFKREVILSYNTLGQQLYRDDLEAVAQVIQNICLIEPGTYPNQPELGVGIENYLFEMGDAITISKLKSEIDKQMAYIENDGFAITSSISMMDNKTNKNINTLLLKFNVSYLDRLKDTNVLNNAVLTFSLLFGTNTLTKKTISKIIL